MNKNILIIDDDISLCKLINNYLERENSHVTIKNTGLDGLDEGNKGHYQLIVLDVMLPDINGFDVLTKLRANNSMVPILMLTAKDSESDKVSGLRLGADDYLSKPFSMNEFIARVESLIRRYRITNEESLSVEKSYTYNNLSIFPSTHEVFINGNTVELTAKEFDLLYFLVKNKGRVFTKKQIYINVWQSEHAFDDNNIMVHIRRLRKKIEPDPTDPLYIETVWGVGYKFNGEGHK